MEINLCQRINLFKAGRNLIDENFDALEFELLNYRIEKFFGQHLQSKVKFSEDF